LIKQIFFKRNRRKRKILISKSHKKYNEYLKKVEKLKIEGNELVEKNELKSAYNKYTEAINLYVDCPLNAIIYANRSWINLKLDNNSDALEDAKLAIESDPNYMKAYYRRGNANYFLFRFEDALDDFNFLLSKFPNEKELIDKIEKTKSQLKKKINSNPNSENNIDISEIEQLISSVNIDFNDYKGVIYHGRGSLSLEWIKDVINDMKNNIYLHQKYLLQIIKANIDIFKNQKSLIDIEIKQNEMINICGDTHGQFYDLLNIFKINGYPSEKNPYLFNGDFVDRGSFSLETITTLLLFKLLYPNHFYLSRGNHEARNLNKIYGFEKEILTKYNKDIYEAFIKLFYSLPLAHVINNKILIIHGGLFSSDDITLNDIRNINRFIEVPVEGIMCELLWSDPTIIPGRRPSNRGVGILFGPDVANNFLKKNNLSLLIRSHECKPEGYEKIGNVLTVFSAPNYCDQMRNKGAIVKIYGKDLLNYKIITFSWVKHPNVPSMMYASPWFG
jgi:serine/threonine-protein phosphatase 5